MSNAVCLEWKPRPEFCYRRPKDVQFVSGEEFMRIAAKAYSQACQAMVPPKGEAWLRKYPEGWSVWATPKDFYDQLLHEIESRLDAVALRRCEMQRVDVDGNPLPVRTGGVA